MEGKKGERRVERRRKKRNRRKTEGSGRKEKVDFHFPSIQQQYFYF